MGRFLATAEATYVVAVVLIGIIALIFTVNTISPSESSEFQALRTANSIALYTSSLSSMEQGTARIELEEDYEVKIEYYDKSFFKDVLEVTLFFIDFKRDGYYATVTPYTDNEKGKGSSVFIISYPQDKSKNLGSRLGKVSRICITKEANKEFAEVKRC